MTSRPRLLMPALLVVATCLVLGVALGGSLDGGAAAALLGAAALLLGCAAASFLSAGSPSAGGSGDGNAALLDDIFASETTAVLFVTDAAGSITRFNPGAESVVGVPAAAAVGRSPAFFLDETELASWALAMRSDQDFGTVAAGLVASEQQQPLDWPFRRPDGERRVLSMTILPIRGAGGRNVGFLCAGRDATDSGDDQSGTEQFLATMSLELRAPMASILGYAEMLHEELEELPDSAGALAFVERIERNGRRMLVLIQDLLTLTRLEDPELDLRWAEVDLRELVTSSYDVLRADMAERRLDLALRLPPDPVSQACDPKLVRHAVGHLLSNAAKFTSDGGRVMVSLKSSGSVNRIVVGDTGLGISQTDRERLFSRFFRSHQPEVQQLQGTGLGLAIVQAVADVHGGSVTVETELGRGSTFVLELPSRPVGRDPQPADGGAVAPVESRRPAPDDVPSPSMSA